MPPLALIFDADGVVIHPEETFWAFYQRAKGIAWEKMTPFYSWVFQECIVWKADLKNVLPPWLDEWEWDGSVDAFLEAWFTYENVLDKHIIHMISGIRKSGVPCYLATNQESYRACYIREIMQLVGIFDDLFISCEIKKRKPENVFFKHILEHIHLPASSVLFIDDSLRFIKAAKECWMQTYHYTEYDVFQKYIKSICLL